MPLFTYIAFNKKGREEKGIVDANNIQGARTKLKAKGLYVKSIQEDREKQERELFPILSKILYRIPRRDVGILAKQLGTLLGAGIPLDKSLTSIIDQTENIYLRKVVIQMKADITEGLPLSESMKKHPDVFPVQYPSLIAVGEQTGDYELTLNRLAELEEKSNELKSKVQVAMVYPFIMGSLSVIVAIFLLTVVIPQIQELFDQFDAELPLITRIVIGLSYALTHYWWAMILTIGLSIYSLIRFKNSEGGRKKWDAFILRVPIIGGLTRKVMISSFSRSLSVLLLNRVPLITSLQIVGKIVDNQVFLSEIELAIERVKEGGKLSESFQNSLVLPQMVIGMVAAGEVSDKVPQMMDKLSEIYEGEVENTIKSMTQSLEPIMIIVMGGLIFTIMAAIMTPMYTLTQNIKQNF
jgi:type II secretory pathway component PulF